MRGCNTATACRRDGGALFASLGLMSDHQKRERQRPYGVHSPMCTRSSSAQEAEPSMLEALQR